MELKNKIAVFLGDSITEGVGASSQEHVYHQVLKKEYGLKEAVNYGISGTRIARQHKPSEWESFDLDFCLRFPEMRDDADIVVVFGGTNDFGHGDALFGTLEDDTPDTYCGAVRFLMRGLLEKYPDSQIVFMTPLHRGGDEKVNYPDSPNKDRCLDDYRRVIIELARYYAIPVLDLYSVSGIQPNIPCIAERYMPDGLHPSDRGNEKIASLLGHFLEQL